MKKNTTSTQTDTEVSEVMKYILEGAIRAEQESQYLITPVKIFLEIMAERKRKEQMEENTKLFREEKTRSR